MAFKKPLISIVVIGPVDSGKSTTAGYLLYFSGINESLMRKSTTLRFFLDPI
jgi:translation elongation factor EF-1alpha